MITPLTFEERVERFRRVELAHFWVGVVLLVVGLPILIYRYGPFF